jgi:hypothetical protein
MTWISIWILLQIPCWLWLLQAERQVDQETSNWIVIPVTFIVAVPACIVIFFVGALFRIMNWAANGRG